MGSCTKYRVFEDAYKSPLSVVVLDNIERLVDFVPIGPRFSNTVLQALMIYLQKVPPLGPPPDCFPRKILIIGTTTKETALADLGLTSAFKVPVHCPLLKEDEVAQLLQHEKDDFEKNTIEQCKSQFTDGVGVKRLYEIKELALQVAKRMNEKAGDKTPAKIGVDSIHAAIDHIGLGNN